MNWVSISSSNGLLPDRRQAITWTNADLLVIGPLGMNFSETGIKIQKFSFMHLKMSFVKWWPFCAGADELWEDFWSRSSRWRSWRCVELWVCCRCSAKISIQCGWLADLVDYDSGRTVSHCHIDWQEANWTKGLPNQGLLVNVFSITKWVSSFYSHLEMVSSWSITTFYWMVFPKKLLW